MTKARTVANFGAVTSDATELNLLDGETDLATQTELNDKAPLASPAFTGTPTGITKTHVGLADVDDESKSSMFTSPTFTGTPVAPTMKFTPTATASAPTGTKGAIYYDSDKNSLMQHDGTVWAAIYTPPASATGGTESTYSGYKVHTFTGDGTFTVSNGPMTADFLIIGGGGSGGTNGGGGGGGGFREFTSITITSGAKAVVIGAGGIGTNYTCVNRNSGENSSFNGYTSTGGGSGGSCLSGVAGGSGGGGGYDDPNSQAGPGGAGNAGGYSPSEGYAGGSGFYDNGGYGGGGGASEVGESHPGGQNDGGDGKQNNFRTGSNVYYSGGGGGGRQSGSPAGSGGSGGGANGNTVEQTASDSPANTGGGGGGSGGGSGHSGDGGSGIVVIRSAN